MTNGTSRQDSARVVITGVGAVTPLAHDAAATFRAMCDGKSGAGPITLFDATKLPTHFACEVKDWQPEKLIDHRRMRELDRYSQFAVVAAAEAMRQAGLVVDDALSPRAGCILGTGMGGLHTIETTLDRLREGKAKVSPFTIPAVAPNLAAGQISIEHKLRGPSFSLASACATGTHAIGEAALMIRYGRADVMIAGGAEATIAEVAMAGFSSMRALSRDNDAAAKASRPFDKTRNGFVCGEGAGVVVLERLDKARARGAKILAEVTGYGCSSDAYHIAAPLEDGDGSRRSMALALDDAGLAPTAIEYLNAHATSTPLGDLAECRAIFGVFGDHARATSKNGLAVSATKSAIGHLLGAAGAVGAVATVHALVEGLLPPTINVDEMDPEIPLDVVPNKARERRVRHSLVNAFGFGGANASLVLSAV